MMSSNSILTKVKAISIEFRFVLLGIALGVLFLPLIKPFEIVTSESVYFLGRFHPLIIHFPIVLILLVLIFEVLTKTNILKIPNFLIGIILGTSLISCLISMILGFLLYLTGEYTGEIVRQHLWGGVLLTFSVSLSVFLFLSFHQKKSQNIYPFYFILLVLANLTLVYTSHQGGSLTHGKEYLSEYFPLKLQQAEWEPKPVEEMLIYEDVIVAFMDRKCMSCHNENKAKGGLILTSFEDLVKGGKGEHPSLVKNSSIESEMYRRVTLPVNDDDFMPPEGKPSLNDNEVSLLKWWIDNGADPELKVMDASLNPEIESVVKVYLSELGIQQRNRFLQKLNTGNLIKSLDKTENVELTIDPYEEKSIFLSMKFPPSSFGDNDLLNLQPIFQSISKASFIGSDLTDDGFYHIGQMTSLKELYLQQTQIKGDGLSQLSVLTNLELLDLSKTQISDGNILNILFLPSLQDLYLNETSISKEVIDAIKENNPALNIHLERGKFF
ncbi:c-type cytochrome domain-containing protein [Aquiflexum sp.]|uniref:c-type cytochrome domain-containing protein n=1 Tax=Aquiflexum sp. TaxID=1872584 RepID=UPI0035938403